MYRSTKHKTAWLNLYWISLQIKRNEISVTVCRHPLHELGALCGMFTVWLMFLVTKIAYDYHLISW